MTDLGLSAFQTGIARGAEPLLHVVVGPIWGTISDRFSRHKTILLIALIVPALLYFSTQYIPPVKVTVPWIPLNKSDVAMGTVLSRKHPDVRWHQLHDRQDKSSDTMDSSLAVEFYKTQNNQTSAFKTAAPVKTKTDSTLTFTLMILLIGGGRLFLSPFNPILDSTVVRMTKEHQADYGRQRMFAALGFGSFSLISGAAIDAFAKHYPNWNKYTPAFYLYIGMLCLVLFPITVMKFPAHHRPRAMYKNVGALFCQIEFLAFLLAAFTSGFSLGALNTFLFIFIDELGGPHVLMGLSITITAASEAVCMYFSSKMIQKLGHKNIFNLVVFCYGLRHIIYSVLYNPWLVAPVGMLHGICFGAFWPTCTSYVNIIAPTGMEASVQSIAHSTYFGLGKLITLFLYESMHPVENLDLNKNCL